MRHIRLIALPLLFVALFAFGIADAIQGGKKPLDHLVYDGWKSVRTPSLSRDGKWLSFVIAPQVGDGELTAKACEGPSEYKVIRGSAQRFSKDGKFLLCTILPAKADVDQAKKDKKLPKDQPKNALGILDLSTGKLTTIERVKAWRLADKDSGWMAYQIEDAPTPAAKPEEKPAAKPETPPATNPPANPAAQKPAEPKKDDKPQKKKDHAAGSELIIRNLATGEETKIADVADYQFSEEGKLLVYAISTKDGAGDGIFALDLPTGKKTPLMSGMGKYQLITISKKADRVAFVSDREDYKSEQSSFSLYAWSPGMNDAKLQAKENTDGMPKGWWIPNRGALRFSESGKRIIFPICPKPEPEPKDKPTVPDDEKAELDVWSWNDAPLMPVQVLRATAEKNKTYDAVLIQEGRVGQLEDDVIESVVIGSKSDADVAIATTSKPYGIEESWDPGMSDSFILDVKSGKRIPLLIRSKSNPTLSPAAKYATWYDGEAKAWFVQGVGEKEPRNITKNIPYPIHDVDDDHPDLPGPQGSGGWLKGDAGILIYDQYDVWLCDPAGENNPVCVTDGYGRAFKITLRVIKIDPDKDAYEPSDTLLLNGLDERSKASGFLRDSLGSKNRPEKLIWGDYAYTFAGKARESDRVLISRQTFSEYPNLWLTNMSFTTPVKVSDANPQQKDYNWATSELVEWTSLDGTPLQGILIKPEDFDSAKKYPMIVYFYERESQNLFRYRSPAPSASTINPTMFASNGYLVFIPDIPYKIGYPGESCVNAVLPGVTYLLQRPYVDAKHIGVQGQSWGGYQVAYLVTRTNIFAAAGAGAAVSNMFSAYGGIRWGSGLVREMQYEHGQSRIGGSIWEKPLLYIENSPLFFADKVTTPVLMMNNDKDGAVPWYQGIEFFTALRRFKKPCWMLVYNNEDHNLTLRKNQKDLSVRLQQFFDHYLKDAPAPVWMTEGVPAVKKGKTYGLEIPARKASPPARGSGG